MPPAPQSLRLAGVFALLLAATSTGGICDTIPGKTVNTGLLEIRRDRHFPEGLHNTPSALLRMTDARLVVDNIFLNEGVVDLWESQLELNGGMVNNGVVFFDPTTVTVSTLIVGPSGYLAETGGPGDRFIITEDFVNQSTQNTLWQTSNTIFQFNGGTSHNAANPQTLEVAGIDIGTIPAGWNQNFVFGTLQIGTSQTYVRLVDDYDNSGECKGSFCATGPDEALYVNDLLLEAGVTLDLNGLALYVLGSMTDNGATILNGSVTVNSVITPDGDVNADGTVDAADAMLVMRFVAGAGTLTNTELAHADVAPLVGGTPQPDGNVTETDALLILRKAAGDLAF